MELKLPQGVSSHNPSKLLIVLHGIETYKKFQQAFPLQQLLIVLHGIETCLYVRYLLLSVLLIVLHGIETSKWQIGVCESKNF